MLSCGLLFLIAELILFQPNDYDNNKLFYIAYMIAVIIVSEYLVLIYNKLKGINLRGFLAALVIISATLSGVMTIIRAYSAADIEVAEYIKDNTDANGVFMTSTNHINPVVSLAGRTIYVGSSLYVHFHGFGEEYTKRSEELKTAYEGSSQQLKSFADENNISYIYVGNNEKQDFNINYNSLSQFEKIYDENSIQIYKVK